MSNNTTLSLTLLLSLSSACGLIKVNGKPLGGGGSSSSSTSSPSSSSSSTSADPGYMGPTDPAIARQERERQAYDDELAAKRGQRPSWCQKFHFSDHENVDLAKFKDIETSRGDWTIYATYFGEMVCAVRGEHHELKPKVMEIRAKWMKQHGLDESDFLVVLGANKNDFYEDQSYEDFDGPVGQIKKADSARQLDVWGEKTSMLARFAYVDDCLTRKQGLLDTVICTREQLDPAKAYAEIEAEKKLNPATRKRLRQLVFLTTPALAKARADIAARAKDDPGIAQVVAIADAQRKEWATPNAERDKLLAQLVAMEAATAANKRSGFTGCDEPTRTAWAAAVKGTKVSRPTFENVMHLVMPATFRSTESYLAYQALALCTAGAGIPQAPISLDSAATERRGPRTATMAALIAARDTIKFDSKDNDNLIPRADFFLAGRVLDGTIAKITPSGDKVTIAFKPELWKANECVQAKETGNIDYISGGQVYYKKICLKTAVVEHDSSPDDLSVPAFWANGLKPGMFLLVTERGFPIVALTGREGTATWVLGASAK